ncbi:hypothetical protein JCM11251_004964 [Rhodosporidiobolus azoricus]
MSTSLNLRTTGAFLLLALVLLAYTLQTELASYVQTEGGYAKPSYIFLLPLHLFALRCLKIPIRPAADDVLSVLIDKYSPPADRLSFSRRASSRSGAPFSLDELRNAAWLCELARKVGLLTVFISAPALSWYGAVPLTNMTDITAIYNVFAFWAYLLSLYYLPSPSTDPHSVLLSRLNPLDLFSVLLAVCGVFVIAYGPGSSADQGSETQGGNRLLGNSLALFGSVAYAGYEVYYKLAIALPSPPNDETVLRTLSRPASSAAFTPLQHEPPEGNSAGEDDDTFEQETSSLLSSPTRSPARPSSPGLCTLHDTPVSVPDTTAFLLYTTLLTSLIGLFTLLLLWIPLPLLHLVGWETFELPPPSVGMYAALCGIALGGVVFNGGFMVLICLWSPVIASVSNLLTLLLVALADQLFMPSPPALTLSTYIGGACIVGAFAGLIWGEWRGEKGEGGARGGGKDGEEIV